MSVEQLGDGGCVSRQLQMWQGEFGVAYTDRNVVDWKDRVAGWHEMVGGLQLSRVLEVGCNRGHNLLALQQMLGNDAELVGVEPNPHALAIARSHSPRIQVISGDIFQLPFDDGAFDLAITSGVLIHIALADLPRALAEMHRVSRRYVLACEYFAEEETVIPYRGHQDLLWKRNFLAHYQQCHPDLRLVRQGYLETWDRATWWLLEKDGARAGVERTP